MVTGILVVPGVVPTHTNNASVKKQTSQHTNHDRVWDAKHQDSRMANVSVLVGIPAPGGDRNPRWGVDPRYIYQT